MTVSAPGEVRASQATIPAGYRDFQCIPQHGASTDLKMLLNFLTLMSHIHTEGDLEALLSVIEARNTE